MAEFNPAPSDTLKIGSTTYRVEPHPMVPSFAFGQEGRKALVFKVEDTSRHKSYALKKFKHAYRHADLEDICRSLAQFAHLPGMGACRRICITVDDNKTLLREYPDLEYAVLMPWMNGSTWYDFIVNETAIDRDAALQIGWKTALVLAGLEEAGLAHCDVAGSNVIIDTDANEVHLVDVEDIYAPGMPTPQGLPAGTDGYNHHTSDAGQWTPVADRFAGAVLLAEILGWHNPAVRDRADEEHYFALGDIQQDCEAYHLLSDTLYDIAPELSDLFKEAWYSQSMDDCPPLADWAAVIDPLARPSPVSEWVPLSALPSPAAPNPGNWQQASRQDVAVKAVEPPAETDKLSDAPSVSIALPPEPGGPLLGFRSLDIKPAAAAPQAQNGGTIPIQPMASISEDAQSESQPDEPEPSQPSDWESQPPVLFAPPDAPQLTVSQPEADGSHLLNWQSVAGATHYVLQQSTSMGFFDGKQSTVQDVTGWRIPSRPSGTYYYRLRAHAGDEFGEWSNIVFVRVEKN